ncbi:hypothetical protein EQG49_02630 [Periweissella cryptocerci]|uniref:Uncharacterized protein n=2 Tax=Periweissella cryptocerci TaxID=2506420 RepID=A0A4P6YRY8_9LACO|nr:hypothetical protein EQG49_02630 [Periweissella cryptocerci]
MRLADFSLSVADLDTATQIQLNRNHQFINVTDIQIDNQNLILINTPNRKALTLTQFFMRTQNLSRSMRITTQNTDSITELWGYRVLPENHSIALK